jgi:1-deoxy-D-xylulose-5-phosphate synthase
VPINPKLQTLPLGKAEIRRRGSHIAILAFGSMLAPALQVGDALNATVVNMRFVKPLDEILIKELAQHHDLLVSVEENTIAGGAGSAVNEFLLANQIYTPTLNLGLPDRFIEHGTPQHLLAECGLDAAGICAAIEQRMIRFNRKNPKNTASLSHISS